KDHCERTYPASKADLATCFVERCLDFCSEAGSVGLVTPQNWLFGATYTELREKLLKERRWNTVARLGRNAFNRMNWWAANTAMIEFTNRAPAEHHTFAGFDASEGRAPADKGHSLRV